jgi:tetratricopeptide (TPR) repeat protein
MFRITVSGWFVFLACCGMANAQTVDLTEPHSKARFHANRGARAYRNEKFQEAANAFTKSLEMNSDYRVYFARAATWRELNQYAKAIEDLTKTIELNNGFSEAYEWRGLVRLEAKEYEQAVSDFTHLLALDHQSVAALYGRARAWLELGINSLALSDIDRMNELEPKDPDMISTRTMYCFSNSEVSDMTGNATQAIELAPNTEEFYLTRGGHRFLRNDFIGATQDYEDALRINKNSAKAMFMLVELLSSCSDPQHRDLERAQEIAYRSCTLTEWKKWEPILQLSSVQIKNGEEAKSLESLRKSLGVAPIQYKQYLIELTDPKVMRIKKLSAQRQSKVLK